MNARTAQDWHAQAKALKYATGHFIDGQHLQHGSGTFKVINPADQSLLCEVAAGNADTVNRAVASGRAAFKEGRWHRLAPRERMDVLFRFAALIEEHAETFALLDTLCMGKPISDMLTIDVPSSLSCVRYFAELIDKVDGAVTNTASDAFHYILREPLGVVACIVPWNYPLLMSIWKISPALAAGNSVILKPAEQSPLSGLLLGELFHKAGGPPGVLNVVNGMGEAVGAPLALHMDVNKIAFTGSTEIGKLMMVYSGQSNLKRVSLECGGKSPQIILRDVEDLDRAVTYAINGIFGNMGEVCNAGSRLLVDKPIAQEFTERFIAKGRQAYQPGNPLNPATNMGPLVTEGHLKRVLQYVDKGKQEGARLCFGGDQPTSSELTQGAFINPALFSGVHNHMSIAQEEIFGPVASIIEVDGLDNALAIANDSIYGLAASVWTSNLNQAHRAVRDLEAGVIWVNCFDHGDMTQPFGGYKQSGFGRDKCMESLLSYTQTKSAWIHLGR